MEDKRAEQETTREPGILFDVCLLDVYRNDMDQAAERGDVPDHDPLESYIIQPVAQYRRRAI